VAGSEKSWNTMVARASSSWLVEALLSWYTVAGRTHLPWRADATAYRVVVSEFMLQQTQVERVIPIFERFIATFPSVRALADASQAGVMRAWKGLGYNSRAVRLHRFARAVRDEHGGSMPSAERSLLSLPGIGPYTMRAIRAFAFGADAIAIDTNIRRVVQRVRLGIASAVPASTAEHTRAAAAFVVAGRGRDLNAALMDLGALICTARAPKCRVCPLRAGGAGGGGGWLFGQRG